MAVRLIAEEGTLSGLVLSLEDGVQWQVGRDPSQNDIVLEDKTVARSQALFFKNEQGFFIRNLDEKVPIKVNGNVIKKDLLLKEHDTILLGNTLFFLINDVSDDANDLFIFDQESDEGNPQNRSKPQKEDKEKKKKSSKDKKIEEKSVENSKNINHKEEKLEEENHKQVLLSEIKQDIQSEKKMKKDKEVSKDKKISEVSKDVENKKNLSVNMPNKLEDHDDQKQDVRESSNPDNKKDKADLKNSLEKLDSDKSQKTDVSNQNNSDKKPSLQEEEKPQSTVQNQTNTSDKSDLIEKKGDKIVKDEQRSLSKSSFLDQPKQNIEKKEDKLTFNVEDLFDFDDSIFPEVESNIATSNDDDYFVDLSHISRFLLKVISGPNVGAEYSLDLDHEYLLGSDSSKCDIVFNDLSVSHQHAKLRIDHEGSLHIEDLSSRNGVVVEGNHIEKDSVIAPDQFVGLGTTVFVIIDHLVPAETIVASPFLDMHEFSKEKEEQNQEESKTETEEEKQQHAVEVDTLVNEKVQEELSKDKEKTFISMGSLIIALCMGGFAVLFGIGTASLFHSQEISLVPEGDYETDLEHIIHVFPGVKFTFNKNSGQLFLLGHVKNGIDKSELLYKLEALSFVKSVDDNIIDDEAVWQEMNIVLSKHLHLKGISMHSPEPGSFVIAGYVKTEEQLNELLEFLNLHFNYLSLLTNKVYVESEVIAHIKELLFKGGLTGLNVNFAVGDLTLTGYISYKDQEHYQDLLVELSQVTGVRNVKNFAVILPLEEGVIDLSARYPNRYQVTGYSKHGDVNINIVINGKILMRGDTIDGMTITSIQANSVFLEKDGVKYKIDYNK